MNDGTIKLEELLDEIDANKLVLPDFQRDYVWIKEEEKIEDFICSVLSQLPIGSIITFKDDFRSFANKEIGFNTKIDYQDNFGKVKFLLDGQQRITTLALVFSDRIFRKVKEEKHKSNDLVQKDKIRRRYFIKLPQIDSDDFENDFFGLKNLKFPFQSDKITFCSNEIKDFIYSETFTFSSNDPKRFEWYYPTNEDYNDPKFIYKIQEAACSKGLIPLYYLTDHKHIVKKILRAIAEKRIEYIKCIYDIEHIEELKSYIQKNDDIYKINLTDENKDIYDNFVQTLDSNCEIWIDDMIEYLTTCIKQLRINTISVDDENTSRAINMYEALNKGGAKLTTYDLIIARAASLSEYGDKSYAQHNKDILSEYCNKELFNIVGKSSIDWNSKQNLHTITRNGEIVPVVINQFLNLLCFVSFNANDDLKMPKVTLKKIPNDYCKAKKQLTLSAEQIVNFSELCMKSIVDALMILQFKCGIYDISQIDYNLILLPLSYLMYLYESKSIKEPNLYNVVNKFCGMYYFYIFTGEYASDQSSVVMKHLEWVNNWFLCDEIPHPFVKENQNKCIDEKVLEIQKYNDFDTLIFNDGNTPKKAVRNSILHYILSENPRDFISGTNFNQLNAWDDKLELEAHHIIPLASCKSIKESTKQIRESNTAINSPLNMALISKEANRAISSFEVSQYREKLNPEFLADYKVSSKLNEFRYEKIGQDDELENILKQRYFNIKSAVIKKIKALIN